MHIVSCTTHGVTIKVETKYLPDHSNPRAKKYVFGYHITIENRSPYTIQLLRRWWKITEATNEVREVEGEGVIGLQPIMHTGEGHDYVSFCNISTETGRMRGFYTMLRVADGVEFQVEIPEFTMISPAILN